MGVEVVICLHRSPSVIPVFSYPEEFALRRAHDGSMASCPARCSPLLHKLMESRDHLNKVGRNRRMAAYALAPFLPTHKAGPSRGSPNLCVHKTTTDFSHPRSLRVGASACGSGFANSFDGGFDRSFEFSVECSLLHDDQENENRAPSPSRSSEDGFWSSPKGLQKGLSLALGDSLATGNAFGTVGPTKTDFGACDVGSSEENSFVHKDLRTFSGSSEGLSPMKGVHEEKLDVVRRDLSCAGGRAAAGVGIPLSLKMLKRRQGQGKLNAGVKTEVVKEKLADVGNSLRKAFSSMVFMMKTLQSHTLHMRGQLFYEEIEGLLNMVQREMHLSLVWLFQQVFSCTPELMVLVMILLADFTVYSMGNNVALAAISSSSASPSALVSLSPDNLEGSKVSKIAEFTDRSSGGIRVYLENLGELSSPPLNENFDALYTDDGWVGNGGGKSYTVAGGADGDARFGGVAENSAMYSEEDFMPSEFSSVAASVAFEEYGSSQTERQSNLDDLSLSSKESVDSIGAKENHLSKEALLELQTGEHYNNVVLDQETMQSLVAPVSARLEADNYVCYDRTDLAYQHAISNDSTNSLLLANYAQFLFLVRHDHNRAEELFRRAMDADPADSEAIGRFASFQWLARHDLAAAERAYIAAMSTDPSNPFHAGNYAHFLWHSGDQEISPS